MASARRIGAPDAKNRGVLLDAAEQLLLEEGYAAVTSRRVAERAGLKPQLVHYYFRTMEDLFLAVFRRRAEEGLGRPGDGAGVAAAAVGAVAVQHRAGGHPADDGVHGPGQPSQGAAGRNRLLRRTFPRGAEQGDRRGAASATASARPMCRRWCGRCSRRACHRVWSWNGRSACPPVTPRCSTYCEDWLRRLEGEPTAARRHRRPPDVYQLRSEQSAPFGP